MPYLKNKPEISQLDINQRKKGISGIILGTIVFVILTGVAISYLVKQVKSASKSLQEKRVMLVVWEQKDRTLSSLREDYKKVEQDFPLIEKSLPRKEGLIDYIAALEDVASKAGVTQKISFEPEAKTTRPSVHPSISHRIKINGDLDSTIAYLSGLENLIYFIKFDVLSMRSGEDIQKNSETDLSSEIYIKK